MDISNATKDEVRYQHRNYAKHVEIAALFGWGALDKFYLPENLDHATPRHATPRHATPVASDGLGGVEGRIFRMSKAAGADLTPPIHFRGVEPVDSALLAKAIAAAGLKPSSAIYDRLIKYQALIPMDNAALTTHAMTFLAKCVITAGASSDYGEGWSFVWLPL